VDPVHLKPSSDRCSGLKAIKTKYNDRSIFVCYHIVKFVSGELNVE
jgi:hypothetical protein